MTPEEFRRRGHELIDWIARVRSRIYAGELPALANVAPGSLRAALPATPPATPESFDAIMGDLERLVLPAAGWRRLAPVPLQTLCVRHEPQGLEGEALDRHTLAWCGRINASGAAWLTPALLDRRWMVRVSVGAEATERGHVEALWKLMRETAEAA